MAITIAIANQKGGVGKTTTTIELGACLKNRGYKVLVIDLEQQHDVTKYMEADLSKPGSYEVLKQEVDIKDTIQDVQEFDLVPSSEKISALEGDFDFQKSPSSVLRLKKALKKVQDDYDFILIDNNPGKNSLLNMSYMAADYLIIPSDADKGSADQVQTVFDELNELREDDWTSAEVMGVLLTRFENASAYNYCFSELEELIERNNSKAFLMKIRKGVSITEIKWEGHSAQMRKKSSNPAIDYRNVADKILVALGETEE